MSHHYTVVIISKITKLSHTCFWHRTAQRQFMTEIQSIYLRRHKQATWTGSYLNMAWSGIYPSQLHEDHVVNHPHLPALTRHLDRKLYKHRIPSDTHLQSHTRHMVRICCSNMASCTTQNQYYQTLTLCLKTWYEGARNMNDQMSGSIS
jgi:hypothetical protein